jgi:hypothetical protein
MSDTKNIQGQSMKDASPSGEPTVKPKDTTGASAQGEPIVKPQGEPTVKP